MKKYLISLFMLVVLVSGAATFLSATKAQAWTTEELMAGYVHGCWYYPNGYLMSGDMACPNPDNSGGGVGAPAGGFYGNGAYLVFVYAAPVAPYECGFPVATPEWIGWASATCSPPAVTCESTDTCTTACTVSNACSTASGTKVGSGGTCNATPAALPDGYGSSCTSSANSCGMTNSGVIGCSGCSASAPSSSLCPLPTPPPPTPPAPTCADSGQVGTYPNCSNPPAAPTCADSGQTGTYPNCSAYVTALLSASPSSVAQGVSSLLTWISSGATSCTGGNFSTANQTSGTNSVTPSATTLYTLTCSDNGGHTGYSAATVTVSGSAAPALTLTASPRTVRRGNATTISWSAASGVTSCSVSGPGLSASSLSGSASIIITAESTYTFSCTAPGSSPSTSTIVRVLPGFIEF